MFKYTTYYLYKGHNKPSILKMRHKNICSIKKSEKNRRNIWRLKNLSYICTVIVMYMTASLHHQGILTFKKTI